MKRNEINLPLHYLDILKWRRTHFSFNHLPPKLEGKKLQVSGGMR
jgi:hypothetical protein